MNLGSPTLEHPTYNCPWEKQGDSRFKPTTFNDCPCALLIDIPKLNFTENCNLLNWYIYIYKENLNSQSTLITRLACLSRSMRSLLAYSSSVSWVLANAVLILFNSFLTAWSSCDSFYLICCILILFWLNLLSRACSISCSLAVAIRARLSFILLSRALLFSSARKWATAEVFNDLCARPLPRLGRGISVCYSYNQDTINPI